MKWYLFASIMMLVVGVKAARATDTYEVHLLHANGLQVVRVMSPDGTVSNNITSLSVKKGDRITFIIDNAFTPSWKYSNAVVDVPFKLSEGETKALKELSTMVATLPRAKSQLNRIPGSSNIFGLDAAAEVQQEKSTIEPTWLRLLARADSLPIIRSAYDMRREKGELGLSQAFYADVHSMFGRIRDTLELISVEIEKSTTLKERADLYKWVTKLFAQHIKELESQVNATTGPSRWTVESKSDEQVVVLYARNRTDTTRVDSLELRLKVGYPRPSFSLDPTLAVLILQSGLNSYSIKTDSTGKASLADTTATTGVVVRPAVQFTWWPAVFGQYSNWAFGPSVYFGYAHDFVFDIGATLSLAYRDVAQLSIGYVSASMPQSVTGEIKADAPIPENAVLNYRRVGSMVICLSIQGLAF